MSPKFQETEFPGVLLKPSGGRHCETTGYGGGQGVPVQDTGDARRHIFVDISTVREEEK